MLISVIDDDEAVRESIHALLESYGHEVYGFDSAESFLASEGSICDCLLVDQHMPGMTGLALLERLRAAGTTTPAIVITGRDDATMHAHAKQIGVMIYCKPVNENVLISSIERAVVCDDHR